MVHDCVFAASCCIIPIFSHPWSPPCDLINGCIDCLDAIHTNDLSGASATMVFWLYKMQLTLLNWVTCTSTSETLALAKHTMAYTAIVIQHHLSSSIGPYIITIVEIDDTIKYTMNIVWLVVSTPLKNISQLGWFFSMYGKIKSVPNHQPEYVYNMCENDLTHKRITGVFTAQQVDETKLSSNK